jgi:ParB family chromosome partitioning protein
MLEMRERILDEKLSVRQTEQLCRRGRAKKAPPASKSRPRKRGETGELPASYCNALTNQVTNALNTKVRIVQNGERGKLEIEYYSPDDLERLVSLLTSALETA